MLMGFPHVVLMQCRASSFFFKRCEQEMLHALCSLMLDMMLKLVRLVGWFGICCKQVRHSRWHTIICTYPVSGM